MLDLHHVTEHLDQTRALLESRGGAGVESLAEIARLSDARRATITEVEGLQAERNSASKAMASLDKKGAEFAGKRDALKVLGARIKELEAERKTIEEQLDELVLHLPNLPHASTPVGKNEHDNVEVRVVGERPSYDFEPKPHDELGVALGLLDFERAAKVSGSRFTILRGAGARLVRGLMGYMLDMHTDVHGYEELWPPALVRDTALRGTGQLPKFAADVFSAVRHYEDHDVTERVSHYLSPTAEVQVTNFHADEIFEVGELPRQYCAYAPCFRSEAGSYGKDTRGLIRQHQFDKVELVHFATPESAEATLDALVTHAEAVLKGLGLHYRVVQLCTGDMGFGSQKGFDLEVWLPAQQAYREISSCSWYGDFQARRAMIRYRPAADQKPRYAHTLNGSGVALGRTIVAILEQYQRADGSVVVPEALRPYMGGLEVLAVPVS